MYTYQTDICLPYLGYRKRVPGPCKLTVIKTVERGREIRRYKQREMGGPQLIIGRTSLILYVPHCD